MIALTALSLSCAGSGPAPEPLRIGLPAGIPGIDPHRHVDHHSYSVLSNAYEGLVRIGHDLRIEPALAERWESPHDRLWRFRLRRGVLFHTGQQMTADDVVASIERARTRASGGAGGYVSGISGARAVDPLLVELTLDEADQGLLGRLASVAVLPSNVPDEITESSGTGPYVLSVQGGAIELTAFAGYWGPAPPEPRALLEPLDDPTGRRRAGPKLELHVQPGLAPEDAPLLSRIMGVRLRSQHTPAVSYLQMRVDVAPFSDRRVRQAIHLALDREALVRSMLLGYGRPASQFVSPEIFGFDPDAAPAVRDVATARRLLAEAGYPDGLDVELEVRHGRPVAGLVAQLAEVGIRVTPAARTWTEILGRLDEGKVPFHYAGFVSATGDASALLESTAYTRGRRAGFGELNHMGYSSAAVDALIDEARRTNDARARRRAFQECQRRLLEDLPLIPVLSPDDLHAVREEIRWEPRLDGRLLIAEMSRITRGPM